MKMFELILRRIALLAVVCCLAGVGNQVAQAQSPTSGAMLTINGTVGTTPVNRTIYDSQIHTGNVRTVPLVGSCTLGDQNFPTDAYVLQGGSWTGCDPGDAFETTQGTGTATITGTGYSFTITTQYLENGDTLLCTSAGVTPTICAGPDTGFLTITNQSGAPFSVGTGQTGITLSGIAVNPTLIGAQFCPPGGVASDSITTLANNASATLALSTDSSNCGGFNASQTQTLTAGQTSIFQIGNDNYQITPFLGGTGDVLTVLPVPVPAGPLTGTMFGAESGLPYLTPSRFSAANFPSQASIPYADLSAVNNPVGLEFQLSCSGPDCNTFLYTAQADFAVDKNSFPTGIGGAHFLGQHDNPPSYNGKCPTTGFNIDIFLSYTATTPDPVRGSGTGNSCFVTTFDPNATAVAAGNTVNQRTFVGFQSPVSDLDMNVVKAGSAVPLKWQTFDTFGNAVTNLTLCTNFTGTGCTAPWVSIGTIAINCDTDQLLSNATELPTSAAGNSGLQNFLNGTYQYNLKTVKGRTGCFTPALNFSTGFVSFSVANFKYK